MSFIGREPAPTPNEKNEIKGTHHGRLSDTLRQNRIAKNARNRSRRGEAFKARGSQSKGRSDGSKKRTY